MSDVSQTGRLAMTTAPSPSQTEKPTVEEFVDDVRIRMQTVDTSLGVLGAFDKCVADALRALAETRQPKPFKQGLEPHLTDFLRDPNKPM